MGRSKISPCSDVKNPPRASAPGGDWSNPWARSRADQIALAAWCSVRRESLTPDERAAAELVHARADADSQLAADIVGATDGIPLSETTKNEEAAADWLIAPEMERRQAFERLRKRAISAALARPPRPAAWGIGARRPTRRGAPRPRRVRAQARGGAPRGPDADGGDGGPAGAPAAGAGRAALARRLERLARERSRAAERAERAGNPQRAAELAGEAHGARLMADAARRGARAVFEERRAAGVAR